ncbi:MAG: OsmC family protein [Candidatus Koribacter versatilis]|uniref:OsmC family protein n=1 Tax=Candidatus Korobacter versatilis TaxID=658062 RepID=A0A932AAR8_9BACT|nr:OsmC family protein [Candidatus Koribacter versatilis]
MVEAKAVRIGVELFAVTATSGHAIVADADRKRNSAASPMELVLMGLCACTATDVDIVLRKKREPFTSLEVRAEAERAKDPPQVYTAIKLTFTVGGKVGKKAMEDAVRLSEEKYCSVSAMLEKTAKISSEIVYLDEAK